MTAGLIAALSVYFSITLLVLINITLSHKRQMFELNIQKEKRGPIKPPRPRSQEGRFENPNENGTMEFKKEGSD